MSKECWGILLSIDGHYQARAGPLAEGGAGRSVTSYGGSGSYFWELFGGKAFGPQLFCPNDVLEFVEHGIALSYSPPTTPHGADSFWADWRWP